VPELLEKLKRTYDAALNIQTYDFNFGDPEVQEGALPGTAITSPPGGHHCRQRALQRGQRGSILRDVLRRNNIDNNGGAMNSSINCIVAGESQDGRQWLNAFWNSKQMGIWPAI